MEQQATVRQILPGGRASVEVRRLSACGHDCARCGGLCAAGASLFVTADNAIGAQEGDVVTVSSDTRRVLGLTALVYMCPIVLFFVGCALGAWLRLPAAYAGGAGFALGVSIVWIAGRRMRRKSPVDVTIVALDEEC